MSVLKTIRDILEKAEFDVYFPSQHKGECLKEYVVVMLEGATQEVTVSSERPIYTLMCYVPYRSYSILEQFIYDIKQTMKQIYPLVMYLGNETPTFYDEAKKAYMISFQYQGCRKLENW